MGRIFLFGAAVVGLLLLTLIYATVSGQVARQAEASPTPAPGSVAPAASGSATAVMISRSSFGPDLTVAAGTTVTFMNMDPIKHTTTNGTNGAAAAGSLFNLQLEAGASASYTFANPGTYRVTCTIHPTMNMAITVQ